MDTKEMKDLLALLDHSVKFEDGKVAIIDSPRLRANIHRLAEVAALETGPRQGMADIWYELLRWQPGYSIRLSMICNIARGRGEVPFTLPFRRSICGAELSKPLAQSFRAARTANAGAFIFDIAPLKLGYTDQRPAEFSTSILAAGIAEVFTAPVFIPGRIISSFSPKRNASDPPKPS